MGMFVIFIKKNVKDCISTHTNYRLFKRIYTKKNRNLSVAKIY